MLLTLPVVWLVMEYSQGLACVILQVLSLVLGARINAHVADVVVILKEHILQVIKVLQILLIVNHKKCFVTD